MKVRQNRNLYTQKVMNQGVDRVNYGLKPIYTPLDKNFKTILNQSVIVIDVSLLTDTSKWSDPGEVYSEINLIRTLL